jgi:phospholipid N-methyltransferase
MRRKLAELRVFFGEFRRNFHTTGAIMPSGGRLAAALTRFVGAENDAADQADAEQNGQHEIGRRVLEVGPGTGAVTRKIIRKLAPHDELHLVELNEAFVTALRGRFESDPAFQPAAGQVTILHQRLETLPLAPTYDAVISGLPLNNFSADEVRQALAALTGVVKPGGTLSFFEYIAVRKVRSVIARRLERERLRAIGAQLKELLSAHEIRRDRILTNIPPAWVHHVRKPLEAETSA